MVQVCGPGLWVVFYGSYFIKTYSESKKGIAVNRLGIGEKSLKTRMIEVFLIFFSYGTAAVQLLSVLFYTRWERLLEDGGNGGLPIGICLAGVAFAVVGTVFFLMAMGEMKENWRAGIDEGQHLSLVSGGVYRISRNPAFVGFDLLYIGFCILFSNGFMLLFAVLGIFTLHLKIKEEEKYMEKRHGDKYKEYQRKTRRYL